MRAALVTLLVLSGCTFDFDRELEPGELRGTIVLEDEKGVKVAAAGAIVRVEGSGITVRADDKGRFVVRGLPEGSYSLRIERGDEAGLRLRNVSLEGARDLGTVVVGGLGSLAGALTLGTEQAEGLVVLAGQRETRAVDGEYSFGQLLPGTYEVYAVDAEGKLLEAPPVEVKPRQQVRVDLDLSKLKVVESGSVQGYARLAGATDHSGISVAAEGSIVAPLVTRATGFFHEGGLTAGVYTVFVSRSGYRTLALPHVVIGDDTVLPDLVLLAAATTCDSGGLPASATDRDGDGVPDADEPEACHCSPGTEDIDEDGICDDVDRDLDNDGHEDAFDNCPRVANPGQEDSDDDGVGDACQDTDGDGVFDDVDLCVNVEDPGQDDGDGDGVGDLCDNCPEDPNADQLDGDNNGVGDVCDGPKWVLCETGACIDWPRVTGAQNITQVEALPGTAQVAVLFEHGPIIVGDGARWQQVQTPAGVKFKALRVVSEALWWAMTDSVLYRYDGATWTQVATLPFSAWRLSLWAADATNPLVLANNSLFTLQGGQLVEDVVVQASALAVAGTAANSVWLASYSSVFFSDGTGWQEQWQVPGGSEVVDLWAAPDGTLWMAVRTNNDASGTTTVELLTLTVGGTPQAAPGDLAPWLHDSGRSSDIGIGALISGTSATNVWAASSAVTTELWHWNGTTWTHRPGYFGSDDSHGPSKFAGLAVSEQAAWASAENRDLLLKFDGASWMPALGATGWNFETVAGRSATDVLARDSSGTLMHWDGSTWSLVGSPVPLATLASGDGALYGISTALGVYEWNGQSWDTTAALNADSPQLPPEGCLDGVRLGGLHVLGHRDFVAFGGRPGAECLFEGWAIRWQNGAAVALDSSALEPTAMGGPLGNLWAGGSQVADGAAGLVSLNGTTFEGVEPVPFTYSTIPSVWASDSAAFAVNGGQPLHRATTGTWEPLDQTSDMTAVWGADDANVFFCGWGGLVLKTDGTTTTPLEPPTTGSLNAVWGTAADDVWFAGSRLLHFDGSKFSTSLKPPTSNRFVDLHMYAPEEGVALTSDGVWRRLANGRWEEIEVQLPFSTARIWASGPNDLWIAGYGGWARFDGTEWKTGVLDGVEAIADLWSDGSGEVLLIEYEGSVFRWNGTDFEFHQIGVEETFASISGPSLAAARLAGPYSVWHWDAGLAEFVADPAAQNLTLERVVSLSATEAWATSGGSLYHLVGGEWTPENLPPTLVPVDAELTGLAATGNGEVWLAGYVFDGQTFSSSSFLAHRDGAGVWRKQPTPLDAEVRELQVVDGVAWGIEGSAVLRIAPEVAAAP